MATIFFVDCAGSVKGKNFGGLIIKQMLVNAAADTTDEFCQAVLKNTKGFIFLGTPHKGANLTFFGRVMSLFGYWTGASTSLLEVVQPNSNLNESLHRSFMRYLGGHCGPQNTVCVFETVAEAIFGISVTQVVDRNSAVIDGSREIGFEKGHLDIQRFASADDENFRDLVQWIKKWTDNEEQHVGTTLTDAEVLKSLAFAEMFQRRNNIDRAHPNTCQWILHNDTYTSWQAQHRGLLWITGKPGAGKSTLMSFIYNAMKDESGSAPSTHLEFFFSGRGTPLQKSSLGMYRALLNQLYTQCPTIRGPIRKVFEDKQAAFGSGGHQWEWQRPELEDLFLKAALKAAQSQSLVIFVDALDEAGATAAQQIAAYFHQLYDDSLSTTKSKIRICFSCRPYPVPLKTLGAEIRVDQLNENDIISFTQDHLKIEDLTGAQPDERPTWESLVEELTQRAAGVFQWVSLVVPMAAKYILDGKSPSEIRRQLRKVPKELSEVYKYILEHVIDRDNRPRTLLLLRWVCLGRRPLTVTELRVAMAATKAKTSPARLRYQDTDDFVDTDSRMERLIVSLSGGLVETTSDEEKTDKTVQVIHQSVNDFLVPHGLAFLSSLTGELEKACCHDPLKSGPWHEVHRSHGVLFRGCLNYIGMEEVRFGKGRYGNEMVESLTPFLQYAITELFHHAEKSNEHYFSGQDFKLGLNELQDTLPKWARLFRALAEWDRYFPAKDTQILHVACQFNLIDIVAELLQRGTSLEQTDGDGHRALHLAAANGHITVVQALLTAGAEVEPRDHNGHTPLVYAAESGHEDIVRLLVSSGRQSNQMTEQFGSALQQAAMTGKVTIVQFLITAGAEVNAQGGRYGNALYGRRQTLKVATMVTHYRRHHGEVTSKWYIY
ncbi:hypothetical protein Z517_09535 [Fonsecaea pedrosoi CBS 271.37]|uniref:Nephrocystin 3-like N-terminal domain-containing protein n=1 Tax=Fonsecaea pedrosoi CBS 271.37 TaxID=1442368 RepID=A0A0D2GXL2_9EURO|nr:uncharacterized protein Z517_09535 [Fonsecaea pedrosoi CBS 271.37]KIW77089.1 hypothetical protein Z517_09535 [Fonsecaea pedrosoi CBS 271.37]